MTTYLSLGSNLGDRELNLAEAIERLGEAGITAIRRSSLYETEPQDIADQPWFLNLVLAAGTKSSPPDLLRAALGVEAAMGRVRLNRRGPRLIDIDILLWGDEIFSSEELQIPHPRMAERRFVLQPLVEIEPELRDPLTGRRFQDLLGELQGQAVTRWTGGTKRPGSNRDSDAPERISNGLPEV